MNKKIFPTLSAFSFRRKGQHADTKVTEISHHIIINFQSVQPKYETKIKHNKSKVLSFWLTFLWLLFQVHVRLLCKVLLVKELQLTSDNTLPWTSRSERQSVPWWVIKPFSLTKVTLELYIYIFESQKNSGFIAKFLFLTNTLCDT